VVKMTRAALLASLTLVAVHATAAAQDSQCHSLKYRSNFRLNGAAQYLSQADAASYPDQKEHATDNALRVLGDAARNGGADEFTMWYLFGRAYVIRKDLRGADSAFTRAAAAAPGDEGCLGEMERQRRNLWVPLQNMAVGELQAQRYDSALTLLREANLIYRDDPSGYMNMGSAFLSQEKTDSAIVAFQHAAHAGTGADRADVRARGAQLAATLLQRGNRNQEAEAAWREYITMKPGDMAARGNLAMVLNDLHRTAESQAIYDSILSQTDSLSSFNLFDTGVSLFRLAQADSVNRTSWFQRAARAFEAGLQKNPYDHDALYNLTNTYLAMDDTAHLLATAERLVAADSMNRRSLSLLAQAQQMNGQRQAVVQTLLRRDSLPFEVSVLRFEPRDSVANIRGGVQNLRSAEHAPFALTLEFLNTQGDVVTSERVDIPTLGAAGSPGSSYDFTLQVSGPGIVAYRYKVN